MASVLQQPPRPSIGGWLMLLGYCSSGLSIFGLVQRYADLALQRLVGDLLTYYRTVFHPPGQLIGRAVEVVLSTIGLADVRISPDAVILYAFAAAAYYRSTRRWQAIEPPPTYDVDLPTGIAPATEVERKIWERIARRDGISLEAAGRQWAETFARLHAENVASRQFSRRWGPYFSSAFWPLWLPFTVVEAVGRERSFVRIDARSTLKRWTWDILMGLAAFLAFFAFNALGPSI